jgi:hypothetical protein
MATLTDRGPGDPSKDAAAFAAGVMFQCEATPEARQAYQYVAVLTVLVITVLHIGRFAVQVRYAPSREWGVLLVALAGVTAFGESMRRCQPRNALAWLCGALLVANVVIPAVTSPGPEAVADEDEEEVEGFPRRL